MQKSILIIDDDVNIANLLKDHLTESGFNVEVAHTLNQGRHHLNSTRLPDILILDVQLPDGSGMDLLKIIRNIPRLENLPVILISAHHIRPEDKVQGFRLGSDDYLVKPFDLTEFQLRIERILKRVTGTNGKTPPPKPPTVGDSSADRASKVISGILAKKDPPPKPPTPKPIKKPVSKKPSIPLLKRILELILNPKQFFAQWKDHLDSQVSLSVIGTMALGLGLQNGIDKKSIEVALTSIVGFAVVIYGMTAFTAWLLQWILGLKQKVVSYKNVFMAFSLGWAPLAFASLLGMTYTLLAKGGVGEFTGGLLLLFPTQSPSSFIGFILRRIDIFEIWGLALLVLSIVHVLGFKVRPTRNWILTLWGFLVMSIAFIKGAFS